MRNSNPQYPSIRFIIQLAWQSTQGIKKFLWLNTLLAICVYIILMGINLPLLGHLNPTINFMQLIQLTNAPEILFLHFHLTAGTLYLFFLSILTTVIKAYFIISFFKICLLNLNKKTIKNNVLVNRYRTVCRYATLSILETFIMYLITIVTLHYMTNQTNIVFIPSILFLIYAVLTLLTKPLIIFQEKNIFTALWASIKTTIKHAWLITASVLTSIILCVISALPLTLLENILPLHFWLAMLILIGATAVWATYFISFFVNVIVSLYQLLLQQNTQVK